MKKRILGIMIAIVMVVGLLPTFAVTASATTGAFEGEPVYFGGGTSTATDTWDGTAASQAWDSGSGTE